MSLQSSWPALPLKGLLPAAASLDALLGVLAPAGRPAASLQVVLVCAGRLPLSGLGPLGCPDVLLLGPIAGKTGQAPGGASEGILGPVGKPSEAKPRPSTASYGAHGVTHYSPTGHLRQINMRLGFEVCTFTMRQRDEI